MRPSRSNIAICTKKTIDDHEGAMTLFLNTAVFGLVPMPCEQPKVDPRSALRVTWAHKTVASPNAKRCVLKRLATKDELAAIRCLLKQIESEPARRAHLR
jgi:hypothetical protein